MAKLGRKWRIAPACLRVAGMKAEWNGEVAQNWKPEGWKDFEARHLPVYLDPAALADAEKTLAAFPPLVFAGEARALQAELA